MLKAVNEVGVWKCGISGSLESSFEDVRTVGENQERLISCDMSLSINTDHRVLISKVCVLFVKGEQNKTRNSYFGLYFHDVSARCDNGKCWPHVPVLPGEAESPVLQELCFLC